MATTPYPTNCPAAPPVDWAGLPVPVAELDPLAVFEALWLPVIEAAPEAVEDAAMEGRSVTVTPAAEQSFATAGASSVVDVSIDHLTNGISRGTADGSVEIRRGY
jgi:hypothetical protein